MTTQEADIRTAVRERYGSIAEQQSSSCCEPGCCSDGADIGTVRELYEVEDALLLPENVVNMSLGCGDPITLAALEPGQVVADLGSGGGIDCFLAARRVGPTGRVIGVDMTPAMLEKARRNKADIGEAANNVEFRLGEIEHLPIADDSVDVIISNCVINLSPDKPQVFREAFRALRPGGKLAVSDMVTKGDLPQDIKDSLSAWAGCVSGAIDVEHYKGAIEAAGFTNVVVEPTYLDRSFIDEGLAQLDLDVAHRDETLYQSLFSAKVTAYKPA